MWPDGLCLYADYAQPVVTRYTVTSEKIENAFRIVLIADGHNAVFGEENGLLIEMIADQDPDVILVAGDMVNGNEAQTAAAGALLSGLAGIAPA